MPRLGRNGFCRRCFGRDALAETALAGDALADMARIARVGLAKMALAGDALADMAFAVWTIAGSRWLLTFDNN